MNPIYSTFARLSSNRHTSTAAIVWLIASALHHLGPMWLPSHSQQFIATADWIKEAAVGYGFLAAPDATKSASKDELQNVATAAAQAIHTGNTISLTKEALETSINKP